MGALLLIAYSFSRGKKKIQPVGLLGGSVFAMFLLLLLTLLLKEGNAICRFQYFAVDNFGDLVV